VVSNEFEQVTIGKLLRKLNATGNLMPALKDGEEPS